MARFPFTMETPSPSSRNSFRAENRSGSAGRVSFKPMAESSRAERRKVTTSTAMAPALPMRPISTAPRPVPTSSAALLRPDW